MKVIIIINIFIISFISCGITIIGPKDLSSQFNDNPIEIAFDKIGKSSYDFYTRGELFIQSDNDRIEACLPVSSRNPSIGNEFQENFKILIVRRGGCSFVQKARNAQRAGYSMIIIVNNLETGIKNVIMSDDGSGHDIHIPIVMISLEDGNKLINYLNNKPKETKVIAEINFLKSKEDYKTIDVKIFFSSSELKAYELFNNLYEYFYKFGDQVNFIPVYVVHRAPFYDPENPIRVVNCISRGRYCYFPKETTITKDGQAIIMEDLRQKCLFDITKKSNNINAYFNYLRVFHSECLTKGNETKFNDLCAKDVLSYLGLSVANIDACVADSFDVKDLLTNSYIDNENVILRKEYDELLKYKLTTFPSVLINNKPLEGIIKETKIVDEICHLIKNKPDFCNLLIGSGDNKRKKFWIYLLICLLVIVNVFIFFIFKKYIIERINERIEQGGLDLDSRVKSVVGNYFNLNKISNDYIRMKNNPSSETDLKNQKGKVVDIVVETT